MDNRVWITADDLAVMHNRPSDIGLIYLVNRDLKRTVTVIEYDGPNDMVMEIGGDCPSRWADLGGDDYIGWFRISIEGYVRG